MKLVARPVWSSPSCGQPAEAPRPDEALRRTVCKRLNVEGRRAHRQVVNAESDQKGRGRAHTKLRHGAAALGKCPGAAPLVPVVDVQASVVKLTAIIELERLRMMLQLNT